MPWLLRDKEIAAVIRLAAPKRYDYFVKKAADEEVIWGLWTGEGWAACCDDSGADLLPVWPHEKYAKLCAVESWGDYTPRKIDIAEFCDDLAEFAASGIRVAVFPTPSGSGVPVEPERLRMDIEQELSKYD